MRDCDISTGILYMSREGPFQLIGKKSILFPTTKRGYVWRNFLFAESVELRTVFEDFYIS